MHIVEDYSRYIKESLRCITDEIEKFNYVSRGGCTCIKHELPDKTDTRIYAINSINLFQN